jgi:mono/diheme cytochrome c family protein
MVRLRLSAAAFASCFLVGLIISADSVAQGLDRDPHDAGAGKDRYLQLCVSCHGANGDGIAEVDLGRGEFPIYRIDPEVFAVLPGWH